MSINNSFVLMLAIPLLAVAVGIVPLLMAGFVEVIADAIRE